MFLCLDVEALPTFHAPFDLKPAHMKLFGKLSNMYLRLLYEIITLDHKNRLTITRARFGGRACQNVANRANRFHCNILGGAVSHLRIGEVPWPDIPPLPRDCLCSDISGSLTLAPMAASTVEAQFTTVDMDIDQDFRDFYFEGRYEFVKDNCPTNWDERRLKGLSGEAILGPSPCTAQVQPWLLEPQTENGYLVLMLNGFWLPPLLHSMPPCPTDARITVYSTNSPLITRDLCPSGSNVVAYSDGWDSVKQFNPIDISKNLVVEFRSPWQPGTEAGEYKYTWMEVFPDSDCPYKCSELRACISPQLWCDGTVNCPSGQDEDPLICNAQLPMSPLQVGLTAAALTIFLSLAAGLAACARRKRVEKSIFQNHGDIISGNSGMIGGTGTLGHINMSGQRNIIGGYLPHHQQMAPHHALPPLYLDSQPKDSFC